MRSSIATMPTHVVQAIIAQWINTGNACISDISDAGTSIKLAPCRIVANFTRARIFTTGEIYMSAIPSNVADYIRTRANMLATPDLVLVFRDAITRITVLPRPLLRVNTTRCPAIIFATHRNFRTVARAIHPRVDMIYTLCRAIETADCVHLLHESDICASFMTAVTQYAVLLQRGTHDMVASTVAACVFTHSSSNQFQNECADGSEQDAILASEQAFRSRALTCYVITRIDLFMVLMHVAACMSLSAARSVFNLPHTAYRSV